MVRIGVIGAGYWGVNLIRNVAGCPATKLVAACDMDSNRLAKVMRDYPGADQLTSVDALLQRQDVDAVVIATPVHTHASLALQAFSKGKHVLVEKPMAHSVADARAMVREAAARKLTLMVDHTFIYGSPVRKMKEVLDQGVGDIHFIDSVRINLGLIQHDVNVIWDLAPHDLSIMDFLVNRPPMRVSAVGTCHTPGDRGHEDVAYLKVDLGQQLVASFHLNWLSPVKIRHFVVGGSRKSIVFNDVLADEKIKVYDRGLDVTNDPEAKRKVLISYRSGDVWSPKLDNTEPLRNLISHFAHCITTGEQPVTDGKAGLRVVQILEAAQQSLKADGAWVDIPYAS